LELTEKNQGRQEVGAPGGEPDSNISWVPKWPGIKLVGGDWAPQKASSGSMGEEPTPKKKKKKKHRKSHSKVVALENR